jgi:predicted nucleic acid-binding protein
MPLDLPDGTACFVDANIFYYALVPTPGPSEHALELIARIAAGRLTCATSVPVLSEVVRKVMISEAAQLTGRDRAGMIGFLNKHSDIIPKLVEYPLAMERLSAIPMRVLPVDLSLLQHATRVAVEHKLLTNDSMTVALMQRHDLTDLIANDDDFDGVQGLTIWKPH